MILGIFIQESDENSIGIVLRTLYDIGEGLAARFPFIVIALIVFALFWIVGRIIQRVIITAGDRTRLDVTLASRRTRHYVGCSRFCF